jgi:hypothetical protein
MPKSVRFPPKSRASIPWKPIPIDQDRGVMPGIQNESLIIDEALWELTGSNRRPSACKLDNISFSIFILVYHWLGHQLFMKFFLLNIRILLPTFIRFV